MKVFELVTLPVADEAPVLSSEPHRSRAPAAARDAEARACEGRSADKTVAPAGPKIAKTKTEPAPQPQQQEQSAPPQTASMMIFRRTI